MKSVQVKAIHVYFKEKNVQKAIFYWNNVIDTMYISKTKYEKQNKNKIK